MPGTVIIRPIFSNLKEDKDIIDKKDIYLKFSLGSNVVKTSVTKNPGKNPKWEEEIKLEKKESDNYCSLEMKNKDGFLFDSSLGEVKIDLGPVLTTGKVTQWYNLYSKDRLTGEVLLDITYSPVE